MAINSKNPKNPQNPIFPLWAFHKKGDNIIFLGIIENEADLEFNFQDYDSEVEKDTFIIDSLGRKLRVKIGLEILLLEVTESIINIDDIEIQDAEDWYQMGLAFLQGDAYDLAIKAFSKAIGLRADYDRAYLYRGMAYQMLGDKGKAENDFRKVLEILEARKDLGIGNRKKIFRKVLEILGARKDLGMGMGNRKKIVEKDLELRAAAILALKALKGK